MFLIILFTYLMQKIQLQNLFLKLLQKIFLIHPRPNNLYKNMWIDHSPQFHLFPLDFIEKIKIILSYLFRYRNHNFKKKNYENWLKGTYGNYFCQTFSNNLYRKILGYQK